MIVYKSNGTHVPMCNPRCHGDEHYLLTDRESQGVYGDVMDLAGMARDTRWDGVFVEDVPLMIEVSSDGRTVWVNAPQGAIARFGELGIDVHATDTASCLYCTHTRTTAGDWEIFKRMVSEYHGVTVGDDHRPLRLVSSDPVPDEEAV